MSFALASVPFVEGSWEGVSGKYEAIKRVRRRGAADLAERDTQNHSFCVVSRRYSDRKRKWTDDGIVGID